MCDFRLMYAVLLYQSLKMSTYQIYAISLHDALPIYAGRHGRPRRRAWRVDAGSRHRRRDHGRQGAYQARDGARGTVDPRAFKPRSEEHTSELQSRENLVCRLLLEKKKKNNLSQDKQQ